MAGKKGENSRCFFSSTFPRFGFISQYASAGSTSITLPIKNPFHRNPLTVGRHRVLIKDKPGDFLLLNKKGRPPPRYLRSSLNESVGNCTLINTVSICGIATPHPPPLPSPHPTVPLLPCGHLFPWVANVWNVFEASLGSRVLLICK